MNAPNSVQARINYTGPMNEKPRYHAMDPKRDVHVLDPRTVQISAAGREQSRLERQGFQLVAHSTAVHDFLDSQELERVYYAEVCDLIRGADLRHQRVRPCSAAARAARSFR